MALGAALKAAGYASAENYLLPTAFAASRPIGLTMRPFSGCISMWSALASGGWEDLSRHLVSLFFASSTWICQPMSHGSRAVLWAPLARLSLAPGS